MKRKGLWLVIFECRYDVVRVYDDSFFAIGYEQSFPLSMIEEKDWIKEITTD